jgi:hypothetical protein
MKQTIKVSADEAVNCIASGNRVFIQTAAASPQQLISVRTKTKQTKKKKSTRNFSAITSMRIIFIHIIKISDFPCFNRQCVARRHS